MKKLNIIVKETNNENIILYLDNKEIGAIKNKMNVDLNNKSHSIYIRYGDKKSKNLELKDLDRSEYDVEINKISTVIFSSPFRLLRIIFLLFITSFCFHKAFGIGYYIFTITCLIIAVTMYLNWNKLVIRKIDK